MFLGRKTELVHQCSNQIKNSLAPIFQPTLREVFSSLDHFLHRPTKTDHHFIMMLYQLYPALKLFPTECFSELASVLRVLLWIMYSFVAELFQPIILHVLMIIKLSIQTYL